jgi:hypothetical protein
MEAVDVGFENRHKRVIHDVWAKCGVFSVKPGGACCSNWALKSIKICEKCDTPFHRGATHLFTQVRNTVSQKGDTILYNGDTSFHKTVTQFSHKGEIPFHKSVTQFYTMVTHLFT